MSVAERITGKVEGNFTTELPFHYGGRIYDINVAEVTENGEPTGKFKPVIHVGGTRIYDSVGRCETKDDAHFEALRWIRDTYRDSV